MPATAAKSAPDAVAIDVVVESAALVGACGSGRCRAARDRGRAAFEEQGRRDRGAAHRRCGNPHHECDMARYRQADQRVVVSGGRTTGAAAAHLGDIAIACETVAREAADGKQGISRPSRASVDSRLSSSDRIRPRNRPRGRADGTSRNAHPGEPRHCRPLCGSPAAWTDANKRHARIRRLIRQRLSQRACGRAPIPAAIFRSR